MKKIGFKFSDGPNNLRDASRGNQDSTIDLSYLLGVLRRRRMLIIAPVLIWMVLGVVYTITTPKFYDASATLLLDRNIDRAIQQVSNTGDLTMNNAAMESARLVITSDQVASKVAEALQLHEDPAFTNPPTSLLNTIIGTVVGSIRRPLSWLRGQFADRDEMNAGEIPQVPPTPEEINAARIAQVADALQARIRVYRIGQSTAFQLSYRSFSADVAARVVNGFANIYVSDTLNANFEATERMTEWMQDRLTRLETDARVAAQAAEQFRAENGLVSNRDSTISQEAVGRLNADLSTALGEAARARAQVSALQAVLDRDGDLRLTALPAINDDEFTLRQRMLGNAINNTERLAENLEADDPRLLRARANVEQAEERLLTSIERLLAQSRGDLSLQEARVSALRDSLADAVSADVDSGAAMVRLRTLEQRAQTLSSLYQTFLAKFQEVEQQKNFPISNVRILNEAQVPRFATGPRTSKTLVFCIIFGLFTGFILMSIVEWRDRFLRTAGQVQQELRMPFLGYLPRIAVVRDPRMRPGGRGPESIAYWSDEDELVVPNGSPLHALRKPRSHYTETLRGIRLSSQLAMPAGQSRVIGVTSARPGEGKSITALNLATVIAASGSSVVLVDLDVHRSGLTRYLDLQDADGLLQVISGSTELHQITTEVPATDVDFIPCAVPEEFHYASELLSNRTLHATLDTLRERYEYVICDLAPMAPVIDVRIMLPKLDQLVMVAEWGKTKKSLLNNLLHIDPELQEKLLGIVLTKVDLNRLNAYISDDDANANLADYNSYVEAR